jgi:N4-(beta-N-acetylglucosaminyl)-L-asparaginase
VAGLRRVRSAAKVARKVLENTRHTLLAGDLATEFAVFMGFRDESLYSNWSINYHKNWEEGDCQPNFWQNVTPDPSKNCGPYKPLEISENDSLTTTPRNEKFEFGQVIK